MAITNGGPLRAPEPTPRFLEFFSSSGSFTLAKYDTSAASMWDGTMEYYTSSGWVVWDGSIISSIDSSSGSYIQLRGTGNTRTGVADGTNASNGRFVITGSNIRINGNIENLLDYTTVAAGNHPAMGVRCFQYLFYNCSAVITAPKLPATTLTEYCYSNMLRGTSITTPPELPATALAENCYRLMFRDCSSLTSAPELPATTLAENCYTGMFYNCASLTSPPELPATTLAAYCYYSMFYGCTGLTSVPELPATIMTEYCYAYMFQNCSSLTSTPELPATTLAPYCYYVMFTGCSSLTSTPELPATTLAAYCYCGMFQNCVSLTSTPELPATTLTENCYRSMFYNCSSLTSTPELPATTLTENCYRSMFYGCTSLTVAPLLQISIVSDYCCAWMFQDCVNLEVIPEIPDCASATTSLSNCFYCIFLGCTKVAAKSLSSGTSNKPYRVPIISGATTKNDVVAGMLLTDKSGESSYTGPETTEGGTYYVAAQVIKVQSKNKLVINAELYEEVEKTLVSISGPSTTSTYHSGDITFIYSDGSTQSYAYSISRRHVLTTDAPGTFTYNRDEYESARLFLVLYDWTDGDMTITDISLARDDGSYFN